MSFQYSAIGDNTPENREHLEKLGYDIVNRNDDRIILRTGYPKHNVAITYYDYHLPYLRSYFPQIIDCIGNHQLFKAVTAITTTTDIGKYYINNHTGQWRKCDLDMATDYYIEWDDLKEASIAELQAHFQRV